MKLEKVTWQVPTDHDSSQDSSTFQRQYTPHPKQLKDLEATAARVSGAREPTNFAKMMSNSSLASATSSNHSERDNKRDNLPGVKDSIEEEVELEESEDELKTNLTSEGGALTPEVEIIKPLDIINPDLINKTTPSPRVKMRKKKSPDNSPKLASNGARLSLVELTVLTKEIGKSIDRNLEKTPEGMTATGGTREEKERKFSQELDEIIENCHAHLDGMIDQMELSANRDSDRSEDHEGRFDGHEGLQAEDGQEDEDKVSVRE